MYVRIYPSIYLSIYLSNYLYTYIWGLYTHTNIYMYIGLIFRALGLQSAGTTKIV